MTKSRFQRSAAMLAIIALCALPAPASDILSDSDVLMKAMADEIQRAMELQLEDLQKPYFIQYTVGDSITYHLAASYGAVTTSDRDRSRDFYSRVRVGAYELDNTNFAGGGGGGFFGGFGGGGSGGRASLPIEDDYDAIRQAIWWATDGDYKEAVETLTKKRAYMRDKSLEDRPNDFSKAPATEVREPGAVLHFDKAHWEQNLKQISGHFGKHAQIQDSQTQLYAFAGNTYIVNSEGTRARTGETGALLIVTAEVQAEDGMRISDSLQYVAETATDLPPVGDILAGIDTMVAKLTDAMKAPILEQYSGPVMFDGHAAGQMFREMLAGGVVGQVEPVGTQRRVFEGAENLEKKLEQRILPKSFQVFDDPTAKTTADTFLIGHYRYDDEAVKAEKVPVVQDGILKTMVMSRVPTKKQSGSNGHGRRAPGSGTPEAVIGCLFVQDDDGVSDEELKAKLIEAARDEGKEFGLRVAAVRAPGIGSTQLDIISFFMRMQQRGQSGLGDPVYAYKVYVDDGREEMVRGVEFGSIEVRSLKDIVAAGKTPAVYNYIGLGMGGATPASSIVTPAVLFEELELSKIEQEHDKLPILKPPGARTETAAPPA